MANLEPHQSLMRPPCTDDHVRGGRDESSGGSVEPEPDLAVDVRLGGGVGMTTPDVRVIGKRLIKSTPAGMLQAPLPHRPRLLACRSGRSIFVKGITLDLGLGVLALEHAVYAVMACLPMYRQPGVRVDMHPCQ